MRNRTKLAVAAVAAPIAVAMASAPAAHADTESLLQAMNTAGFTDQSGGASLVHNARQVCSLLDLEDGEAVAHDMYLHTDLTTMADARRFVVISVFNLCPWQYHPQAASAPSTTV